MLTPEEIRILGLSAPILHKVLQTAEDRIINSIYGEFTAGRIDQTINLARLAAIRELKNQLNQAHAVLDKKEEPRGSKN